MSKIKERVLRAQDDECKTSHRDKQRVSVVTNATRKSGKPGVTDVKGAVGSVLLTPTDSEAMRRKLESQKGVLGKSSGKIEFIFYKILLCVLYMLYACARYTQYHYNRAKILILNLAYSPSNTPQLIRQDVLKLQKLPKRLAAIVEKKREGDVGGGVSGVLNDGSDLVAWTISAGIKHLALYDFDGHLKRNVDEFRKSVFHKLTKYYDPSNVPKFAIRIPQWNKVYFNAPGQEADDTTSKKVAIEISLLSNRDGRETIIELTRTMADLCAQNEMQLSDITMKLIDSELTQLVGHEPDLLLYFGPNLDLQGFPPWHIRLTEFYWEQDNDQVTYSVFIRGLKKYAACKINVGK